MRTGEKSIFSIASIKPFLEVNYSINVKLGILSFHVFQKISCLVKPSIVESQCELLGCPESFDL